MTQQSDLYIVLISIHGLIRGHNLELGRNADTGGQTKYVVELARALGQRPEVARVDLLTRRIEDENYDADYAASTESLDKDCQSSIVRIECGGLDYITKEQLWDHMDYFADNALAYLKEQPQMPHLLHSHYADAGYVGALLSHQLSIPLLHTGHSLGRSKRQRLLASGVKADVIETRYKMSRRIEAEEYTLGAAERVITSTHQEIEEQYGLYDYYQPDQMRVIPPGVDLQRFFPPQGDELQGDFAHDIRRFYQNPDKPLILALSRPDPRKNIIKLVEAYGESTHLQEAANLLIVAGNRDNIHDMDDAAEEVLTDLLLTIDLYDLYGKVAYPKHHSADEVSEIYRLAALSGGVFINPALTEPFGLTLLEAAASGLPIVATEDGGPIDIINNCQNGHLVNPLDKGDIAEKLLHILNTQDRQSLINNGIQGVQTHYSWQAHAQAYLQLSQKLIERTEPLNRLNLQRRHRLYRDRSVFTDLDQNLLGNEQALAQFVSIIKANEKCGSFGIATGRRLDSVLKMLKKHKIPVPDVLISSLGTEIYYSKNLTKDTAWSDHINHDWQPGRVKKVLRGLSGLSLQAKTEQSPYKISYFYNPEEALCMDEIKQLLLQNELAINLTFSFGQYLDIIPIRASKGLALRWYAEQWGIALDHILVAGGSGADEDMLRGNPKGVIVANRHNEELSDLVDLNDIYLASQPYAAGIIEAIDHYDFFNTCTVPNAT